MSRVYNLIERYGGLGALLNELPYYPEVRIWNKGELIFGSKVRIKDGNTWYVVPYINYVPQGRAFGTQVDPLKALNHFHKEVYTFLLFGQISGNTPGYNGGYAFERDPETKEEKDRFLETIQPVQKLK